MRLTATSVVIHDEKNHQRFRGSLLPRSAERTDEDDTLYSVDINRDLARVLSANLFLVDWEKRRQLQQKPLAAWLQRAERFDDLIDLLRVDTIWPYKKWAVHALVAKGQKAEALR